MDQRAVEPHIFVVFGGSGDLMRQKLLPALYHLRASGRIPEPSYVLAVARRAQPDADSYRNWACAALREAGLEVEESLCWCRDCLSYFALGEQTAADYARLSERIAAIEAERGLPGNRVFYLALPPEALAATVEGIAGAGAHHGGGWTRVVTEKPFGHDLASAQALDEALHRCFDENELYRIDHYLGKETVQNLMVLRFANPVFEALWNREHVHNVQITVAETKGVGTRATYYDRVGAVRDMVQNHLTQLLTLMAMEVPARAEAAEIHTEKTKVLRSISPILPEDVVLGQYMAGEVEGRPAPGYLEEKGIGPNSRTETYAAIRVNIANWRWEGVPFYLRTGKRLPRTVRQIVVTFKRAPLAFFCPFSACELSTNSMVITLEPDEGFELQFQVKAPGEPFRLEAQRLHFRYDEVFGRIPEAYEALLLDLLEGDQTLFVRSDTVEESWRVFAPLLEAELPLLPYAAGSWGPPESDQLLARGGATWQTR